MKLRVTVTHADDDERSTDEPSKVLLALVAPRPSPWLSPNLEFASITFVTFSLRRCLAAESQGASTLGVQLQDWNAQFCN
jgi:hypothetical protein